MPAHVAREPKLLQPIPSTGLSRRIRLTKRDYAAICAIAKSYQGSVVAADLDPVYQRFPAANATRSEFYTSLSDGKHIFVHRRRLKAISTLVWDVAHLLGHMFQWNMTSPQARRHGLRFYGAQARRLAVRDFRGASRSVLQRVLQYELEADRFAYTTLLKIRGADQRSPLAAAVADFVVHDLTFIIDYYLRRRSEPCDGAVHDPVLGPELAAIRSKLDVVALPDPKSFRFHAFDLLSVPVVHG